MKLSVNPLKPFFLITVFFGLLGCFLTIYNFNRPPSGLVAGTQTEWQTVIGLVIPHHNIPEPLVRKHLARIAIHQQPEEIIILSPNHFCPECPAIATNPNVTKTALALSKSFPGIYTDSELIENEHGIQYPARLLKEYFPNTQITPLIYSAQTDLGLMKKVAARLNNLLSKNILFVASVDFSHETSAKIGLANNQETVSAIVNRENKKLLSFDNEHLDSPAAMIQLTWLVQNRKADQWQTWESAHSALLTNQPQLAGTSYIIGAWVK